MPDSRKACSDSMLVKRAVECESQGQGVALSALCVSLWDCPLSSSWMQQPSRQKQVDVVLLVVPSKCVISDALVLVLYQACRAGVMC